MHAVQAAADHPKRWYTLLRAEVGATAVEYGLMLALVAVAIIASVAALGTSVNDLFANEVLLNALQSSP